MDVSAEMAGKWWTAFWWVRGVIAALTLISVVPIFIDLSRSQLLKAFQVFALRWSDFTEWLGFIIGELTFLPELSAEMTTTILFTFSICFPAAYGLVFRPNKVVNQSNIMLVTFDFPKLLGFGVMTKWILQKSQYLYGFLVSVLLPLMFYFALLDYDAFFSSQVSGLSDSVFLGMIIFSIGGALFFGILAVPIFAKTLFLTLSFLGTLELLYLVNTPYVGEWIDKNFCENVDQSGPECSSN